MIVFDKAHVLVMLGWTQLQTYKLINVTSKVIVCFVNLSFIIQKLITVL